MEKQKDPIGQLLRKARKDRDISVPELAELLGIPKDRIYKWEKGAVPKYEDRLVVEKWIGNADWKRVPIKTMPPPPGDNGQKVVLDLNVLLELLRSAQHEKSRLMDVIDANLTTLASTQQIILAHVKAGHKWEAKKYGGGAEVEEKSILSKLNTFADEYLPDGELSDKNVQGRK